jgi:hypothetical protein
VKELKPGGNMKGSKNCPKCQRKSGCRLRVCPCGYNFVEKSGGKKKSDPTTGGVKSRENSDGARSGAPTDKDAYTRSERTPPFWGDLRKWVIDLRWATTKQLDDEFVLKAFKEVCHDLTKRLRKILTETT